MLGARVSDHQVALGGADPPHPCFESRCSGSRDALVSHSARLEPDFAPQCSPAVSSPGPTDPPRHRPPQPSGAGAGRLAGSDPRSQLERSGALDHVRYHVDVARPGPVAFAIASRHPLTTATVRLLDGAPYLAQFSVHLPSGTVDLRVVPTDLQLPPTGRSRGPGSALAVPDDGSGGSTPRSTLRRACSCPARRCRGPGTWSQLSCQRWRRRR